MCLNDAPSSSRLQIRSATCGLYECRWRLASFLPVTPHLLRKSRNQRECTLLPSLCASQVWAILELLNGAQPVLPRPCLGKRHGADQEFGMQHEIVLSCGALEHGRSDCLGG